MAWPRKTSNVLRLPTRGAVLIGCPDKGSGFLPGVSADLGGWRSFLTSDLGGAWRDSEIKTLTHPEWEVAEQQLREFGSHDFTLVVFSGHGQYDPYQQATMLEFPDASVDIRALRTGSSRQVIITDSCRTIVGAEFGEERFKVGSLVPAPDARYRASCRQLYDKAFLVAEVGTTFVFAASIGEGADETEGGGEFTRYLLGSASNWAARFKRGGKATFALSMGEAFQDAARRMERDRLPQHPQLYAGRRRRNFPIAVI